MDEEIAIIDANTRNTKIKNFFVNNKKKLIAITITIIIIFVGYLSYEGIKQKNKQKIANQYNSIIINHNKGENKKIINDLTHLVGKKDITYSPLALYFLIDNELIKDKNKINNLFDVLINQTKLEAEIKNLIVYKKALYNSDSLSENELIQILKPIINSKSIWESHALYLIAEYFYSKNEKQKAKEFFNQILLLPNANIDIKTASQKRLNRDLGE